MTYQNAINQLRTHLEWARSTGKLGGADLIRSMEAVELLSSLEKDLELARAEQAATAATRNKYLEDLNKRDAHDLKLAREIPLWGTDGD